MRHDDSRRLPTAYGRRADPDQLRKAAARQHRAKARLDRCGALSRCRKASIPPIIFRLSSLGCHSRYCSRTPDRGGPPAIPMSSARKRFKKRRDALWAQAKGEVLAEARQRAGLSADEAIADAVLVLEVDHYLPTHAPNGETQYDVLVREEWFFHRLSGLANTEEARRQLADSLKLRRGTGRMPWGLGLGGPPRRSQDSGRHRTERRQRA